MNLVLQASLMIAANMKPPVAEMCWQVTPRIDSSASVLSTLQQVVGSTNHIYIYIYIYMYINVIIYVFVQYNRDATWTSFRLKLQTSSVLVQQLVQPNKDENAKAPYHCPFCEGFPLLTSGLPYQNCKWYGKRFNATTYHALIGPN